MYKYSEAEDNVYVLSIDNHEEIMAALKAFCIEKEIYAGRIDGIGAVNEATLRFLNPATKQYVDKTFKEQMEISNLIGNVSMKDGDVYLHVHVTLGREDYTAVAGHLLTAHINGACELYVRDFPDNNGIGRKFDPETGLNLYDF